MNLANLRTKAHIIKLVRRFFDERGYTEMHTPRLVGVPGQEPYLEPFWTTVVTPNGEVSESGSEGVVSSFSQRGLSERGVRTTERVPQQENGLTAPERTFPAALITSPEYMMKRLLGAGLDRIYDLGPCFRNNEPWDGTHDPEFLLLEWYRKHAELDSLMDETEEMVKWVMKEFQKSPSPYEGEGAGGEVKFRRLTVEDAWREYAGIELAPLLENREAMADACRAHGQTVHDSDTWDDLYFKIFLSEIEPKITGEWLADSFSPRVPQQENESARREPIATFLYRYPLSMAALARPSKDDPRWADRVELYIGGMELANGFAELEDAEVQRKRFEEERELRASLGKNTWPLDEAFLAAIPRMENAVGIAFGVDRLVMLLTHAVSINEVVPSSARERFGQRED